ncbi:MAG: DUF1232 domain-containing protein [Bacteroidales bacterium]|nr:DUF1232 domain-containing protein [Bacteroidales bacterium]
MEYDLKILFGKIAATASRVGRPIARQLLYLYFVLTGSELTSSQKLWIGAAIAYIIVPNDFLPRRIFRIVGITDDALALMYVINKVRDNITPEIIQKVDMLLDQWFGYRIEIIK